MQRQRVNRRLRIIALSAVEMLLDVARAHVRVVIAQEMLADARESIDAAERQAAEVRAARVPQNGWN